MWFPPIFECTVCGETYVGAGGADECEESHKIKYANSDDVKESAKKLKKQYSEALGILSGSSDDIN